VRVEFHNTLGLIARQLLPACNTPWGRGESIIFLGNLMRQKNILGKAMSMRFMSVVLMTLSGIFPQVDVAQESAQPNVVPLKNLSKLAMDRRYETVSGDAAKAGAPFVIRIHAEAGYIIMPHTHPEDENIVVVKGSWALGMGDRFTRSNLKPMEVGDYGFAPKTMPHFALSKTDTIIQVHGIGPFITRWVVPVYELTDKGVLMKVSGADAGHLVPNAPEGCFALKLGTAVRSSYGEGLVVGAQCTPSQLTQYRVEGAHGERFWAAQDELNTP
jgi:hypothetical protein